MNSDTIGWNLEHSYTSLPNMFYERVSLNPVASPRVIVVNRTLAESLGLDADALKEGEYSDVIESEYGCYVAYVESDFDAAATEERKVEIVEERESALYLETYQKWADASEFVVNEEVWEQVTFAAPVTVITGDAVKDSDEVETYELNEDGEVVNSEDAE